MAEDDVERLVEWVLKYDSDEYPQEHKLARIVRELLAEHPVGECECAGPPSPSREAGVCYWRENRCGRHQDEPCRCGPCDNRRLRERCNRLARGEEA